MRILLLLKDYYIKHKKLILVIVFSILIALGILVNNVSCNKDDKIDDDVVSEESNTNKSYNVSVVGEVKKEGTYLFYDECYLYEIINIAGGLTDYAYIDDINMIEVIKHSCEIKIEKSDNKNNNKINIIDLSESSDTLKVYNGRIDGNINIYIVNRNISITNLKWQIEGLNTSLNDNYIIESDTCLLTNCIEHKMSINLATLSEMEEIDDISDEVREAIVEYRNKNGMIKSFDELKNISIITTKILNIIKTNFSID